MKNNATEYSNPQLNPNRPRNPRDNVPSAWYDLNIRILSACAVLDVAIDHLPMAQGIMEAECNTNSGLVSAAKDLLSLCKQDVALLERQLLDAHKTNNMVDVGAQNAQ